MFAKGDFIKRNYPRARKLYSFSEIMLTPTSEEKEISVGKKPEETPACSEWKALKKPNSFLPPEFGRKVRVLA